MIFRLEAGSTLVFRRDAGSTFAAADAVSGRVEVGFDGILLACVFPVVDNRRPQSHDLRLMHRRREQQSLEMHRRIAARLVLDPEAVLSKAYANLDRWHERHRGSALEPVFQEWRELLGSMHPAGIAAFITAADERSTRLRQSSPFAGVLTPREVWAIKKAS